MANSNSIATKRVDWPELFNTEALIGKFVVSLDVGETFTFTGQTYKLEIDPPGGLPRITIANGDSAFSVSPDGLTLTISKPGSWVTTNFPTAGLAKYWLSVGADASLQIPMWGKIPISIKG